MQRIVNDRTPVHVLPTVRTDVPLPKMAGRGRPKIPLNPVLMAMQPGHSFVLSGEKECNAMRNALQAIRKAEARPDVKFVTRTLTIDPTTFEAYPPHTMGVWAVAVVDKDLAALDKSMASANEQYAAQETSNA